MKPQLLLIAFLLSTNLISKQSKIIPDSLDLLFSFPCIAFDGEYGVECDEEYIYTTQIYGDSIAKYSLEGELLEKFSIPGVSNVRDMAYDGEFCYGGTNDYFFYVIDMVTKSLIIKWEMPVKIHSIAYDDYEEVFWINEEGSNMVYCMEVTGAMLDSIFIDYPDQINISGIALFDDWYGANYLWVLCQDPIRPLLLKYNLSTKMQVGYEIDLSSLTSGQDLSTGGLYIGPGESWDDYIIGGVIQDHIIFGLDMDYANQLVSTGENTLPTTFEIFPNPTSDKIIINVAYCENQQIICRIFNDIGQPKYENSLSSNIIEVDIKNYPKGTYIVQLIGSEGYSLTKKFVCM